VGETSASRNSENRIVNYLRPAAWIIFVEVSLDRDTSLSSVQVVCSTERGP